MIIPIMIVVARLDEKIFMMRGENILTDQHGKHGQSLRNVGRKWAGASHLRRGVVLSKVNQIWRHENIDSIFSFRAMLNGCLGQFNLKQTKRCM